MRQLRCADLLPGDIMLKVQDGSVLGRIISLGQRAAGQLNSFIIHAGVMFDSLYIIEAQRGGVLGRDLRVRDLPFGYIVYRPTLEHIARGAAACAKMLLDTNDNNGTIGFNFLGMSNAIAPGGLGKAKNSRGMDKILDGLLHGRGHTFYCSQFVTYVFQFVAEQNRINPGALFNAEDARVSPSRLASLLQDNHWFKEAGYMLPNQR